MTNLNKNGEINEIFTGTGASAHGFTGHNKTLIIKGSDAFTIDAEVTKDFGATWVVVKSFTSSTVENFEWEGRNTVIRFNCSAFTSNPVSLSFE
jgi:hypothetical protein